MEILWCSCELHGFQQLSTQNNCLYEEDFNQHNIQANRSINGEFRRKNQLKNNLGFWRFELASLLPLAKQKINGV
jgi:hypothetical protein